MLNTSNLTAVWYLIAAAVLLGIVLWVIVLRTIIRSAVLSALRAHDADHAVAQRTTDPSRPEIIT